MTQLPSLERWALLSFWGFPTLTCFLFFWTCYCLGTCIIFLSQVVLGLSLGLYFLFFFVIFCTLFWVSLWPRKSVSLPWRVRKGRVLDRDQNDFWCEDDNNKKVCSDFSLNIYRSVCKRTYVFLAPIPGVSTQCMFVFGGLFRCSGVEQRVSSGITGWL